MPEKQLTGDNSSDFRTYTNVQHVRYSYIRTFSIIALHNMYSNVINAMMPIGAAVSTSKYVQYVCMYNISSRELSLST